MGKLKLKKKTKTENNKPLGSLEQMKSKKHLESIRSKHRKGGTLDNYCDLLETQINSLVEKVLSLSEKPQTSSPDKHINQLRKHINSAQNELNMAQIYARDNGPAHNRLVNDEL